jgi:polar amino acid transport system substrate-binding protein
VIRVRNFHVLAIGLVAVVAAACSGSGAASPSASSAPAATVAASVAPSVAEVPSPSPDACAPANLALLTPGTLTIGTDNPAYPPYFAENADGTKTAPWELGDPTNGKGFESAFAYTLATTLGFTPAQVAWAYVPFDNSFKPGPKAFDLDINQISFSPERAQAVDMSDGYYFVNQAVVTLADNPISAVTKVSDLAPFRFGAQDGTTSYKTITDVIKPTTDTSVYNSNDAAIAALNAKQIDAIVVDLPTAFYMAAAQLDNGKVVGQFEAPASPDAEHFSVVLAKDSPLTTCVNAAIGTMRDNGRLESITQEWLSRQASAPVFAP